MGARIERVHRTDNLCRMLPLGCPSETGSPRVENLMEGAFEGEGEGTLKEGAASRPCYHDGGKLFQHGLEVATSEPHVVKGKGDQAASSGRLDGTRGAGISLELDRFSSS